MHSVPNDIEFGEKILALPSLRDVGILPPMDALGVIKSHIKPGQWVERGQPLVTHRLFKWRNPEPAPAWQFWKDDPIDPYEFTIKSPVFALVLANKCHSVSRIIEEHPRTYQSHMIWSGDADLPILLLPRHEPPWESYDLQSFYRELVTWIARNWKLNVHNPGGSDNRYAWHRLGNWVDRCGPKSMPDAAGGSDEAFKRGDWLNGAESCEKAASNRDWHQKITWQHLQVFDYRDNSGQSLKRDVDHLRTNDRVLYSKLQHLNDPTLWADTAVA
jgi:hypothetical protein